MLSRMTEWFHFKSSQKTKIFESSQKITSGWFEKKFQIIPKKCHKSRFFGPIWWKSSLISESQIFYFFVRTSPYVRILLEFVRTDFRFFCTYCCRRTVLSEICVQKIIKCVRTDFGWICTYTKIWNVYVQKFQKIVRTKN